MAAGLGSLQLTTDEAIAVGDRIVERGTFSFLNKEGSSIIEQGK